MSKKVSEIKVIFDDGSELVVWVEGDKKGKCTLEELKQIEKVIERIDN